LPAMISRRICVALLPVVLVTSCVSYPRIDTRPIEQQLADRPAPKFTAEEMAIFASADRTKPFRLSFRGSFRSCTPLSPPIRAMLREKVSDIEGVVTAVVLENGLFASVKVTRVEPELMKADVEELFSQALTTQPCRLPPLASPLTVEFPFTLRLN
jgi:hypothetical protein